jgi:hypothetical protein
MQMLGALDMITISQIILKRVEIDICELDALPAPFNLVQQGVGIV